MKELTKTIIRLWDFFFSVFSVTFEWGGGGGGNFLQKFFPVLENCSLILVYHCMEIPAISYSECFVLSEDFTVDRKIYSKV